MSGSYDSRILTLVANIPIALPPARQYVVLSASVNSSALGIAIGDGNGDFTAWPAGLAIKFDRSIPARLISTVSQSVAIGFTDGGVTLVDSRNVPIGPTAATIIDGGDVALGARADAAATTDTGTFSLIALFKRMLTRMGPVTSVDGGLITLGTTTDASAPADNSNVSLIALVKRLLSKTGGSATPYATVVAIPGARGSAFAVTVVVTAVANINGIQVSTATLTCGTDVTASASLNDNTGDLAIATDSQVLSLPSFTIPAGRQLRVLTTGLCYVCVTYRLL